MNSTLILIYLSIYHQNDQNGDQMIINDDDDDLCAGGKVGGKYNTTKHCHLKKYSPTVLESGAGQDYYNYSHVMNNLYAMYPVQNMEIVTEFSNCVIHKQWFSSVLKIEKT